MKIIKNELQNIITGNGQKGGKCLIKKTQVYLGGNEIPSFQNPKIQYLKSEEERSLILFIEENKLFYEKSIQKRNFIAEGAEQKVYCLNDLHIIKLNDTIFYEFWKDHFNSLLIHNYFFESTKYELLGFKLIDD